MCKVSQTLVKICQSREDCVTRGSVPCAPIARYTPDISVPHSSGGRSISPASARSILQSSLDHLQPASGGKSASLLSPTQFLKFLYKNSNSESTETLIGLQFSLRIAKSVSLIISQRNIRYFFTIATRRNQEWVILTRLVVLVLIRFMEYRVCDVGFP